jgi:hypothetical protein
MSHFCQSRTNDDAVTQVAMAGAAATAFVWGGASGAEYGQILDIWSATGAVRIRANEATAPGNWICSYTIPAEHVGKTFIGVKPGTAVRETVNSIKVVASASAGLAAARKEVMDNVRSGKIKGVTDQLSATSAGGAFSDGSGRKIFLADGMWHALAVLSRSSTIDIMSMMRFGQGFHGDTKGRTDGTALCSAMDITIYAGNTLNLINGDNVEGTIAGTVALISSLPRGEYGFGLTRPSPMANGPQMPDKDVFLPCTPTFPMYTWGQPLANPTPSFVNEDAKKRVNDALMANPRVVVRQMFMDGPDHVHLHVWSADSR